MKVKKITENGEIIKTAILFSDNGHQLNVFSDYDEDMTCAILKCYIDNKFEKVTEDFSKNVK